MSCTLQTKKPTNQSQYLKLPKSTLQTQFAHGAQSDVESDFKFETEYLLDCSIPNKPPGQWIFLEECLSDYFTNIVQVRRKVSPMPNYFTKPHLSPSSYPEPSLEPPPYSGGGNSFSGIDEKAALKKSLAKEEGNVAAWQVLFPCDVAYIVFQTPPLLRSYI